MSHVIARARYRVVGFLAQRLIEVTERIEGSDELTADFGLLFRDGIREPNVRVHGAFAFTLNLIGESCSDGSDDDGDGLADCDQWDCQDLGVCQGRQPYRRGDLDGNARIDVTDALWILRFLFTATVLPVDCTAAVDADGDGEMTLGDALALLQWLFRRRDRLPEPFVSCGRTGGGVSSVPTAVRIGSLLPKTLEENAPIDDSGKVRLSSMTVIRSTGWFDF